MRGLIRVVCGVLAATLAGCAAGGSATPTPTGNAVPIRTGPPPSPGGGHDNIAGAVSRVVGAKPTIQVPKSVPPTVLRTEDVVPGAGAVAGEASTVTARFIGLHWTTGKPFYSSWDKPGGAPDTFSLTQVITGFAKGVSGMRAGGRREIIIPPALGYGAKGSGQVGPGETLVFVVDLVSVA